MGMCHSVQARCESISLISVFEHAIAVDFDGSRVVAALNKSSFVVMV